MDQYQRTIEASKSFSHEQFTLVYIFINNGMAIFEVYIFVVKYSGITPNARDSSVASETRESSKSHSAVRAISILYSLSTLNGCYSL